MTLDFIEKALFNWNLWIIIVYRDENIIVKSLCLFYRFIYSYNIYMYIYTIKAYLEQWSFISSYLD